MSLYLSGTPMLSVLWKFRNPSLQFLLSMGLQTWNIWNGCEFWSMQRLSSFSFLLNNNKIKEVAVGSFSLLGELLLDKQILLTMPKMGFLEIELRIKIHFYLILHCCPWPCFYFHFVSMGPTACLFQEMSHWRSSPKSFFNSGHSTTWAFVSEVRIEKASRAAYPTVHTK